MEQDIYTKRSKFNLVTGVAVGWLLAVTIIFVLLNNSLREEIELVRSGDIYAKSVTEDKLADELFATVGLLDEDGNEYQARVISGKVIDNQLVGKVELETENGTIINATIIDKTTISTVELEDGSVTTPKLDNGAVTEAKLADGAVVNIKLSSVVLRIRASEVVVGTLIIRAPVILSPALLTY
ncbi:MAG TPA: hypothetical protein ENI23_08375, partial [bacterium]|nr:hypothetical protein [bacterium]